MSRARYLNKKTLAEALALFVDQQPIGELPEEVVAVEDSLGRITARAIRARISSPHYHGAAMDGIAVRAEDTFGASEARPVDLARHRRRQRFSYVDTGHPLPPWANAVIMIEHVVPTGKDTVQIRQAAAPWQHVRLVGEDIVATEPLLPRGHRIRPFDIGALLAAGHVTVPVTRRPVVAILPTGGELIEPGSRERPGAIIEFNSRVTAAFLHDWGAAPVRLPRVADDPEAIVAAVRRALRKHDIVVVIAGSSAGEHDFTAKALGRLGEILVHGIDIMPGKPAICARIDGKPVLGLPGYPVSAIIVAQQVLRPLVARYLGRAAEAPETVTAVVPRKIPSRLGLEEFVRVTLGEVDGRVVATPLGRGAGVISTMVKADGFLRIGALSEGVNAGEQVNVELLRPRSEIANTIVFTGSHDPAIGVLEDALKRRAPHLKIAANNIGSLGGLVALDRGEAHVAGSHLLDPQSGTYNLPDVHKHLRHQQVVVIHLVVREQGLIVRRGNPQRLRGLRDLTRPGVRFVNRQAGAGTRVLLDYLLGRLRIPAQRIDGYEREEMTHMAVAVAVASGLADAGMGVRAAAQALNLSFVPLEREDYDLILRRDFAASERGKELLAAIRSDAFRRAVTDLGGYDARRSGEEKVLLRRAPARRGRVAAQPAR